jgi:uncharacterized protein (DUF305 family)
MKLNIFRIALLLAAVAGAIAFAGCSADDGMSGMGHNSASPAASSSATPVGEFNEADVMFVQMMIPHHEQAVDMMNAWLETWGRVQMPEGAHHSSSDGMMTEQQMQELDEANSAEGQRLFLEGMIRHHQGAIKMAQAEITSGKNPEAITLAKNIAESQQAEVDTMTELLNKI